jgi:uncharacterized protein (DUF2252 family)
MAEREAQMQQPLEEEKEEVSFTIEDFEEGYYNNFYIVDYRRALTKRPPL